ncbi:DUF7683 domain-containing protein [Rosenbergiella nectarea]|uniref:DUF7683 domain-containing protein n=1 Tax=Rosenbergiella nectarea TaxID=988801 RepID=UPI001BDB08BA|nr:hypothetical protein [Rosenbergiella nectarea]MBT0731678.1 hypothetical protein [Rosenbergiella nectarea subsp. apis]
MTIVYTIDVYSKVDETLLLEIEIPENKLSGIAEIMGWSEEDKKEFLLGIGVYNINENQAIKLESLLCKKFYSSNNALQISGGSV